MSTASAVSLPPSPPQSPQGPTPIQRYLSACQQGDLSLIRELIENNAVNVNDHLEDQVSGLHWAAINNKLLLCRYLVSKGAEVDAVGGDLNATPLHWACRYGLVYIADFLLQSGADPEKRDGQGFTALHLAVHSSNIMLVVYLLMTTNVDVDREDPNERTPLHWAAYQGDALSVEALLKFGANVNRIDNTGFTSLHWALICANPVCLKTLIKSNGDAGVCDIFATTKDGKTAFDIAADMGHLSVFQKVLRQCGKTNDGYDVPVPEIFIKNPKLPKVVTFLVPYIVIGLLLEFFLDYYNIFQTIIFDTLLLIMSYVFLKKMVFPSYVYEKEYVYSPLLAGIFSSTAVWAVINWLFYVLPNTIDTQITANVAFLLFATLLFMFFHKAMTLNPGKIAPYSPPKKIAVPLSDDEEVNRTLMDAEEHRRAEAIKGVKDLVKLGKFDSKNFCVKTFVRRPLRLKYSEHSGTLVARFDHFCPWVYNDVGLRNHRVFMFFVITLLVCVILFSYLSIQYFNFVLTFAAQFVYTNDHKTKTVIRPPHSPFEVYNPAPNNKCSVLSASWCNGWTDSFPLFILNCFCIFQGVWVTVLLILQLVQIAQNKTSYEVLLANKKRPEYYASPVPVELLTELENPYEASGGAIEPIGHPSIDSVMEAAHSPPDVFKLKYVKKAFMPCLKVTGISHFYDMFMKRSRRPNHFNFGWKVNCAEFWCLGNTSKSRLSLRNFFRIQAPDNGETYIGEQLVDYYHLYEYPIKRVSYRELV